MNNIFANMWALFSLHRKRGRSMRDAARIAWKYRQWHPKRDAALVKWIIDTPTKE